VVRRPDPADARLVRLHLTARGRAVREPVREARAELERQATATLTVAEREHLRTALTKIIDQLRSAEAEDRGQVAEHGHGGGQGHGE
jgi:DNA-binding MarR family transcriptional regulator